MGFVCKATLDVFQSISQLVYMCLHLLMFKHLYCSALRAVVGAPAVEGQCVERQLRLAAMRANAVKGTS